MNNPRKDVLVLGVLVLAAVIGFYIRSQNNATSAPTPTTDSKQEPIKQVQPSVSSQPDSLSQGSPPPPTEASKPTESPTALPQMPRIQRESRNAIRDFEDTAGINIKLPDGIDFRNLDIDSTTMTGIYGKLPDMEMAVVAGKGNITQDQIVEFIRSQDTGIPNLDRTYVEIPKAPKTVATTQESGMGSGSLWTGSLANGDVVHVAVLPRKDGAGSYMVIVSGKEAAVEGFDDEFENVFKSVKARPVSP